VERDAHPVAGTALDQEIAVSNDGSVLRERGQGGGDDAFPGPERRFRLGSGLLAGMILVLAVACASTPSMPPTIRLVGAVDVAEGVRLSPGTRISIRLTRGGETLDEVVLEPGTPEPPFGFELLYDREQAGGVGAIVAEARRGGRVVLATIDGVGVPLDGTPRTVVVRLAPPRRAVGP